MWLRSYSFSWLRLRPTLSLTTLFKTLELHCAIKNLKAKYNSSRFTLSLRGMFKRLFLPGVIQFRDQRLTGNAKRKGTISWCHSSHLINPKTHPGIPGPHSQKYFPLHNNCWKVGKRRCISKLAQNYRAWYGILKGAVSRSFFKLEVILQVCNSGT